MGFSIWRGCRLAALVVTLAGLALARAEGTGQGAAGTRSADGLGRTAVSPAPQKGEQPGRSGVPLTSGGYPVWCVSVASDGTQGNSLSMSPSASADGQFVAFSSWASNLVSGDTNGRFDIFVRDRTAGTTERVSVASDGTQGNDSSNSPSISGDGRFVAFQSLATNLVSGDTNSKTDIFVRDRLTGTTERVSVTSGGAQGIMESEYASISADGQFVAFHSLAYDLVPGDTNNRSDVFVRDRTAGTTERVSVASDGTQGNEVSQYPSISSDGQFVAFHSWASNLVSGDTNAAYDIFVRDRTAGTTERVSVASDGTQGNASSSSASINSDGQFVAFKSDATDLVPGDTNVYRDIFVHDRLAETTELVSVASDGTQGNTGSSWASISGDGRYVAFASSANTLVSGDTNGCYDVFVRDCTAGTTERVSVASDGTQGNGASSHPGFSSGGRFLAFDSEATNLVSEDTNDCKDVFIMDRGEESTIQIAHGVVATGGDWTWVALPEGFSNPVVVAGPASRNDPAPGVIRLRFVQPNGFAVRFQEWDYLDGVHESEKLAWVAVDSGVYDLGGGDQLVAQKLWTNKTNPNAPRKVMFPQPFGGWPVVLCQVQTNQGPAAVTDRIVKIFAGMFAFVMQEEEAGGTHGGEQIGYIAVSQGVTDIGGVTCDAKRAWTKLKHPPTWVGTALGGTQVFVEEEQSADTETEHWIAEYGGFLGLGGQPPYVADLQTCWVAATSQDTCVLRCAGAMALSGTLTVSAEAEGGAPLSGVVIGLMPDGDVIVTGAAPVLRRCDAGTSVMLVAPESIVDGGEVLGFSHWEAEGEARSPGLAVINLKMTSNRAAIAVYAPAMLR